MSRRSIVSTHQSQPRSTIIENPLVSERLSSHDLLVRWCEKSVCVQCLPEATHLDLQDEEQEARVAYHPKYHAIEIPVLMFLSVDLSLRRVRNIEYDLV